MSDTRTRLIDGATALLDQGGPEAVTLREVGRLAGVSHNTPYRHFADKKAMLATVAMAEMEHGIQACDRVAAGDLSLRQLLLDYVRRSREFPHRFRLIYSDYLKENEQLLEMGARTREAMACAVAVSQEKGEIPAGDPHLLGQLIFASAYGAAYRSLFDSHVREVTGTAQAEALVTEMFRYLELAAR